MTALMELGLCGAAGFIFWAVRSLWCKIKGKEKPSLILNVISASLVIAVIFWLCGLI